MTTTVTDLKAQLGLNFPKKLSGTGPQVITQLLKGFTEINEDYAGLKPPQVHASEHIRHKASELFEELGPDLWPDLDKQAGVPSWLSCSSDDSDEQQQSRCYYSNITDRKFLADRFYDLVCLKLNHHNKNTQRVNRRTNPRLEPEDLIDGEEAKSCGRKIQKDVSVLQNVAEDRHNDFVYHPTPETSNVPSEEITPLSIDQEVTQSIAVAAAPYLSGHNLMGKTPSKLIEGELEFPNNKLKEHMVNQRERTDRTNLHQLNPNSAGLETLPSQTRMEIAYDSNTSQSSPRFIDQNEWSLTPTMHNTKRPSPDDTRGRRAKRSKKHSDVQTAKPSLVVVLKLTRGKGVSIRPMTVPPQQPQAPIPFVEDDEISVRYPSVPASHNGATHDHCQKGQTALQQTVEPFDTASRDQPTRKMSSLNNTCGIYESSSEPKGENRNMPVQPGGSHHCPAVATATLGGSDEASKDDVHLDEQPRKSSPALNAPKAIPEERSTSEVVRDVFQSPTFDYKRLVRYIDLTILIDFNDGLEPKKIGIVGIEGIMDSNDFFKAVEYEYGWRHEPDEEFFTARVTEADGSSRKWPRTDLSLRNATRRDRSWYKWLSALRTSYEREGVDIEMDLVARVQVTRKSGVKG